MSCLTCDPENNKATNTCPECYQNFDAFGKLPTETLRTIIKQNEGNPGATLGHMGVNLIQGAGYCFKHYATFKGVASKSEFWSFFLFAILAMFGGFIILINMTASAMEAEGKSADVTMILGLIAFFGPPIVLATPLLAAAGRRLHDTGISGKWLWMLLVPIVGTLFVLVALGRPSKTNVQTIEPAEKTLNADFN